MMVGLLFKLSFKKAIFNIFGIVLLGLPCQAREAFNETTDQKIDGVARELALISSNLDLKLDQLNRASQQIANQLEQMRVSIVEQQQILEPLLESVQKMQTNLETKHSQNSPHMLRN